MQQITLLQVARKKGLQISKQQLQNVGHQAGQIYREVSGAKPEKIPQAENGKLYQVNAFPEEFEVILDNLLDQLTN